MNVEIFGLVWYKRKEYETLRRLFTDGDSLPALYDDWLKSAERVLRVLRNDGHAFRKVYIDPNTFPQWCAARGLEPDAKARSRFGAEAVASL
jgi:hypothetical protein